MAIRIDIAGCLESRIGETGLTEAQLSDGLARLSPFRQVLARRRDSGELPLLALPQRRDDLAPAREVAAAFAEQCDEIVILGTGGSSLGGKTIHALAEQEFGPAAGHPRLHFLDNVDPATFQALLGACDPTRLGVLAISKSGGTAETLCQTLVLIEHLRQAIDESRLAGHVAVITEPKDSPLKALAERYRLPCIDHDPNVGGRYAALSIVGVLPALLSGLDPVVLREGADAVLETYLAGAGEAREGPAGGAVIAIESARLKGRTQSVLMPYVDRLESFAFWYRQLWAESLGKQGQGTTPINALGTVDQHSQLQLYLDGPADKLFTLITLASAGTGPVVDETLAADLGLDYLAGRRMGDLLDAEARATAETLLQHARPTRLIHLERLDEHTLGGLFMHFMLETMLAAELLGVNPFDQPAVEQGKVLTQDFLRRAAR